MSSARLIVAMARHRQLLVLLAIPCCFCASEAWASGLNLVDNGNFTAGTDPTQFGTATDNLPVDWGNDPPNSPSQSDLNVVTQGSESITAPAGYTGDYVAFTSKSTNGQDCLYQDIPTVVGDTYTLTFDLGIVGASSNLYLAPEWESGSIDTTYYGLGNGEFSNGTYGTAVTSSGTQAFQQFSFQVQAESTTTTLWFHGVDESGAVLLADVSLTQNGTAPEPSSLSFIGIGLVIIAFQYKKRLHVRLVNQVGSNR